MIEALFLGFLLGFCVGGITLQWMYKRWVIAQKAKDGTAELIGDGWYYIITNDDWTLLEAWRLPMLRRSSQDESEGQS